MKDLKPELHRFLLRLPKKTYSELEKKSHQTMYAVNLLIIEAINKSLEK